MNRTKIEWLHWSDGRLGYSWNPIKGLCPVRCWYCYARRIYQRFGQNICANYEDGYICLSRLEDEKFPSKPARIFVCSTFELFHGSVDKWRDDIFKIIAKHTDHTFFILTKRPELIDRPMPENVWLGVSITKDLEMDTRLLPLKIAEAEKKFISFEPLLEEIVLPAGKRAILYDGRFTSGVDFSGIDWIIVGRLTGHGRKLDPKPTWVEAIAIESGKARIPIFMKDNLASIWPGVLLQEFPK